MHVPHEGLLVDSKNLGFGLGLVINTVESGEGAWDEEAVLLMHVGKIF